MRTNIELDDRLVSKAMRLSGISTKKGVIQMLLEDYIRREKQREILKFRGKKLWTGNLAELRALR